MKDVFLHVGYPKTATTLLQKRIFGVHPQVCYLGRTIEPRSAFDDWLADLLKAIKNNWKSYFDEHGRHMSRELLQFTESSHKIDPRILVSHEGILSTSFRPRHSSSGVALAPDYRDTIEKVHGMGVAGGLTFKPIITLRRQDALLFSYYAERHYIYRQLAEPLKTFEQYVDHVLRTGYHSFGGALLDFDKVIRDFEQIFGATNVLVMVYEEMEQHPEQWFQKLACFLGVDPKPWVDRYRDTTLEANPTQGRENQRSTSPISRKATTTHTNLFQVLATTKRRLVGNTNLGIGKRLSSLQSIGVSRQTNIETSPEIMEQIRLPFCTGNMNLAKRLDLPLSEYDYYR